MMSWVCANCEAMNAESLTNCEVCQLARPWQVTWNCPNCETINPDFYLQCEVCRIDRPADYLEQNKKPVPKEKPALVHLELENVAASWTIPGVLEVPEVLHVEAEKPTGFPRIIFPGHTEKGAWIKSGGFLLLILSCLLHILGGMDAIILVVPMFLAGIMVSQILAFKPGNRIEDRYSKEEIRFHLKGRPVEKYIEGHKATPTSLSFSPKGDYLLSLDQKGKFIVIHPTTGTPVDTYHPRLKRGNFFVAGGRLIGVHPLVGHIRDHFRGEQGKFRHTLKRNATRLVASPNGKLIAIGTANQSFYILPVPKEKVSLTRETAIFKLPASDWGSVTSLAVSDSSNLFACGFANGKVHIFSLFHRNRLFDFRSGTASVTALSFDHDGDYLATGNAEGAIQIQDLRSSKRKSSFNWEEANFPPAAVSALTFDGLGRELFFGDVEGRVFSWTWRNRPQKLRQFEGKLLRVNSLAVDPTGKFLAASGAPLHVELWPLQTSLRLSPPKHS